MVQIILGDKLGSKGDFLVLIARVLLGGLLIVGHGLPKFGLLGGQMATDPIFIIGGIAELVIGVLLITGLFTRLAGLLGVIEMLGAYFMVHAPRGLSPLENGGELALVYLSFFLVILVYGSGKYGVERVSRGEEKF